MHKRSILSLATAALLAGAGAAYAADSDSGNKTTPQTGGAVKSPPGAESTLGTTNLAPIGDWAIGRPVYNRAGETIGTVKQVQGDKVTVSVGSYLGIGSRDIELGRNMLNPSGSGSDMRLITNLTKAELAAQPAVRSDGSRGSSGTGRPLENPNTGPSGTR